MALGIHSSNITFIQMKRKGYRQIDTTKDSLKKALNYNFDYIILQNDFMYNDVISEYPVLITQLKKISDNGLLSLYTKKQSTNGISILQFLGFPDSTIKKRIVLNYDSLTDSSFEKNQKNYQLSFITPNRIPDTLILNMALSLT